MSDLLFSLIMLAVFLQMGITEKGFLKWIMYVNVATTLIFILSGAKLVPMLAIIWMIILAMRALELVGKYVWGLVEEIRTIKFENETTLDDAIQRDV
ncbi:MAG TPA: hypothetical protein PLZ58_03710 [Candidatus Saccharibacteria bacterium]|nr:hypothetical protein [Candidatus Saccharibacteria bacterium]HRQ06819.1 hypothetical protein [Candidatus Saccharibacteria bacterium]